VEAGKEIFWMCNILKEFGYKIDDPLYFNVTINLQYKLPKTQNIMEG